MQNLDILCYRVSFIPGSGEIRWKRPRFDHSRLLFKGTNDAQFQVHHQDFAVCFRHSADLPADLENSWHDGRKSRCTKS